MQVMGATPSATIPRWSTPAFVAGLWLLDTLLHVAAQVVNPDASGSYFVSSILYLSAGPVFAALLASAIARRAERLLPIAAVLLLVDAVATIFSAAVFSIWILAVVTGGGMVARLLRGAGSRGARIGASLAAMAVLAATPHASALDHWFAELTGRISGRDSEEYVAIDPEKLWTEQPALVERALAGVDSSSGGTGNAFLIAVAAGGSQDLFGREARLARSTLGRVFGAERRSLLLANDEASLHKVPLAVNSNLDAALAGIARKMDRSRDVAIVYLASHGGRGGDLSTDLPNYDAVDSISARVLAETLNRAGIRRRIVIVSACFAGSWIKPLASADTIVIAASHANRTSFGCTDERELSYFGEALLKGKLASGASLSESFAAARQTVTRWEKESSDENSDPQAFVGRNMAAVWKSRASEAIAAPGR